MHVFSVAEQGVAAQLELVLPLGGQGHARLGAVQHAGELWVAGGKLQQGSWWPAWNDWLNGQMSIMVKPLRMGMPGKGCNPIEDAPGTYVFG